MTRVHHLAVAIAKKRCARDVFSHNLMVSGRDLLFVVLPRCGPDGDAFTYFGPHAVVESEDDWRLKAAGSGFVGGLRALNDAEGDTGMGY